jgi:hypothetical protein
LFPHIILAPQHGPERLRGNVVWAQYGDFKQGCRRAAGDFGAALQRVERITSL